MVKSSNVVFDSCRGSNHGECQKYFSIPYQNGGMYESYCTCSCHRETEVVEIDEHSEWEVDDISIVDKDQLSLLAEEAASIFDFDEFTFMAACWVAEKALSPDSNNSFPFWKAYEEAKSLVLEGSNGTITLCTGKIHEGKCVVCKGTPAINFTNSETDLQIHLLKHSEVY